MFYKEDLAGIEGWDTVLTAVLPNNNIIVSSIFGVIQIENWSKIGIEK